MWFGLLFFVGAMAALLSAWVGVIAVPLIVFYAVVVAIDAGARSRSGAGPLGFGLMLAVMALYQGTSCPAVTLVEGGMRTCEGGPDVRVLVVIAAVATTWGVVATYRQSRRRPGPL